MRLIPIFFEWQPATAARRAKTRRFLQSSEAGGLKNRAYRPWRRRISF
jgi:hypothetical protein